MVTPLEARQPQQGVVALQRCEVEEALLMGALEHLHAQFRGMLITIGNWFAQTLNKTLLIAMGKKIACLHPLARAMLF